MDDWTFNYSIPMGGGAAMERITITVSMSKDMVPYLDVEENGLSFEQSAMLLCPLIQNCVISHGRAAEIFWCEE